MKVKFVPQNVEFEIKPGQSVMHVAQDHNIYIKSVCKGVPSCAECRVRIIDGEHNVLPPGSEELSLIGTGHFIDRRRLSCQLKCFGDITVDMNEQIKKQNEPLSGNKARKMQIKDDRIEDTHTRTRSSVEEDGSAEDSIVSSPSFESSPSSARAVHAAEAAPGNAGGRPQQGGGGQRPRQQQQNQQRQQGSQRQAQPQRQGGQPAPQKQGGGQQQGQPRPSQGQQRPPQRAQASGPNPNQGQEGGGGGKKRRRRRGRGGKGGGGGGAPTGGGAPS